MNEQTQSKIDLWRSIQDYRLVSDFVEYSKSCAKNKQILQKTKKDHGVNFV